MHTYAQHAVAAYADTMFPPHGPIPISGVQAGIVAYVDSYIHKLPATRRLLVRLLLLFIQLSPLIFGPRRSLFTRLSPTDQHRVFAEMAASTLYFRRVAFVSLRAILTMGYFACPQVNSLIIAPKQRTETL